MRARLEDGAQIDVEMQAASHAGLRQRGLYYWGKLFVGQLERGDPFAALKPCVCIFILNFREFSGSAFHSEFRVQEVSTNEEFSHDLRLHVLELPKLLNASEDTNEPAVLRWGRFFAAKTDEELEHLAMTDPDIQQAKQALDRLSDDPKAREIAAGARARRVEV